MHKAAVAVLAVPIMVAVYIGVLLRRSTLARVSLAIGLSLLVGIGLISVARIQTTAATLPRPIVPLTEAAFSTTVATDRGVMAPVTIQFSTPMDPFSVAAAVQVEPATPVELAWDGTASVLTITPRTTWAAGVLHTVTVQAGALARSGQPLARPARAVFLTRAATTTSASATIPVGERVSIATAFVVSFARPVDPDTVVAAIGLDPPTPGVVRAIGLDPPTPGGVQATDPGEGSVRYTFVPIETLLPDTMYRLTVAGVRDADGLPVESMALTVRTATAPAHGTFTTAAKRAPAAPAPANPATTATTITTTAVGGGSWGAVETYYLGLMNCTRTGGWVTSTGKCSSPGGRNVAPLKLDSGMSSTVSRPYAKRLAVGNDCSHFIGGNPGDRLRRAGYTSYRWAENLGCRSGNPYAAVLGSHLFFQSEKSYNGGHYVNLMNAKYDRVGIGVWVSGGRVRLVIDFYHA